MTNGPFTTFNSAQDKDGVDPKDVPQRLLYTGSTMPAIGLGTFGSDSVTPQVIAEAVVGAAAVGYRHFDCAAVYGNEAQIGEAFQTIMHNGLRREELWVTSKLWNDKHAKSDVIPTCKQSLKDLGLDYLDAYLVHWPFPNHHPQGADVHSRSAEAKPYIQEQYMETWYEMEKLVEQGLVRHIGTSNMTIPKLKLVLRDAHIKPAVNEMELHPHFQQPELFNYVIDNGIAPIGFSPIGSPNRPARDKTSEDTTPSEDPVIVRIAERLGIHPAVVCIKWAIQRGQTPIPFSTTQRNYLSNLRGAVSEPLTDQDMADIAAIDKNNRFIKGQVFLWKENQSWEDLWDISGEITPA